jgi:hypothetical protein
MGDLSSLSMPVIALLAGLIGSVLTVAIGKILDLIQKRQEHRYSLQKTFFERKLKVAEAIVINSYKAINLIAPLNTLLKKLPELAVRNIEITNLIQSQADKLSSLLQETDNSIYATPLYFDTPAYDSRPYEKLLDSFTALYLAINTFKSLGPDVVKVSDPEKIIELFKPLLESLADLIATMEHLKTGTETYIRSLRDQMRKYEA